MGGETPYVDYAIIALVVIIFGVLVGFSFKVWRVLHALLVISVFLAVGAFISIAAAVLKTDTAWHKVQEDYAARVIQQDAELLRLTTGLPGVTEEAQLSQENSLRSTNQRVDRILIGRGLVWRGMLRASVEPTGDGFVSVILDASYWGDQSCVAPGAVAAPAPPTEGPAEELAEGEEPPAEDAEEEGVPTVRRHGLQPGMLVFAFREQPATAVGIADLSNLCRVPQTYLGQFRVVESAPDSASIELISLLPREEMNPSMLQAIEEQLAGNSPGWTLYQTLPTDRHDVFADFDAAQLQQIMPVASSHEYVRHLMPISQIQTDENNPIPPQNIWVQVRFTQPHTIQVDTPALAEDAEPPAAGNGLRREFHYFDQEGLAVFPELRQGGDGTIAFEPGAEIVIPTLAADRLLQEGIVEEVERVYVRPLRQYQTQLAAIRVARRRSEDKIAVLEIDNERQTLANAQAGEQTNARQATIVDLTADVAGFRREAEVIVGLREQLTTDYQNIRAQTSQLYEGVKDRAQELTRIHAEILQRLDSGEEPASPAEESTDLASADITP